MDFKFNDGDKVLTTELKLNAVVKKRFTDSTGHKKYIIEIYNKSVNEYTGIKRVVKEELLDGYYSIVRNSSPKPEPKFHIGEKVKSKTKDGEVIGSIVGRPVSDDPAIKYLVRFLLPGPNPESPAYMETSVPQSMLESVEPVSSIFKEMASKILETKEKEKEKLEPKFHKNDIVGFLASKTYRGYSARVLRSSYNSENTYIYDLEVLTYSGNKEKAEYTTAAENDLYLLSSLKSWQKNLKFQVGDVVIWNKLSTNSNSKAKVIKLPLYPGGLYTVEYTNENCNTYEYSNTYEHDVNEKYLDKYVEPEKEKETDTDTDTDTENPLNNLDEVFNTVIKSVKEGLNEIEKNPNVKLYKEFLNRITKI